MKYLIYILVVIAFAACTSENTDTSVKETENPVKTVIEIDTPPPLDSLMFNRLALECYYHLGQATGGEFYYKTAPQSVHNVILEVLSDHGVDGSDILFLIDKTGSMQNDIDSVRVNLNKIITQLQRFDNIRLGVAAFGDKNVDGKDWFSISKISENFSDTRNFVNTLSVSDGGDYPESVYDGIAEFIEQTDFRNDAKKLLLVIGDAPSLEDSLSSYNREEIVALCVAKDVKANIFPILVSAYSPKSYIEYTEYADKFLKKVYPNPASDVLNIELSTKNDYTIALMDYSGKVIASESIEGLKTSLQIPLGTPNGKYVLRVIRNEDAELNAEEVVIQR
jgi:hypothetical protein